MAKREKSGGKNRDVNAAQRAILAVSLRAKKMPYEQIAQQCGYASPGAAHNAIQRELQRTVVENVEELRREEADGLDRLEAECWKRLEDEEHEKAMLFAVDRILAIKERRAKLFGLDVPTNGNVIANQVVLREVPQGLLPDPPVVEAGS